MPVVTMADVTDRITYGFTSPMTHVESGIPILTAKSIRRGSIDYSTCDFAVQSEVDDLTAKSKPERGDVLVTKDGTIGRCAVFRDDFEVCINQSVALVRPCEQRVEPEYLAAYIGTASVQQRFQRMKKGNAVPHLQISEFAKFPIPCPPLEQQSELRAALSAVEEARAIANQSRSQLDCLFASLQQRAFRGEL